MEPNQYLTIDTTTGKVFYGLLGITANIYIDTINRKISKDVVYNSGLFLDSYNFAQLKWEDLSNNLESYISNSDITDLELFKKEVIKSYSAHKNLFLIKNNLYFDSIEGWKPIIHIIYDF